MRTTNGIGLRTALRYAGGCYADKREKGWDGKPPWPPYVAGQAQAICWLLYGIAHRRPMAVDVYHWVGNVIQREGENCMTRRRQSYERLFGPGEAQR